MLDLVSDTIFNDPVLSMAVEYAPAGGAAVTVRALAVVRTEEISGFGRSGLVATGTIFRVLASEVPAPAEGDNLERAGTTYVVQGEPRLEPGGHVWRLDAYQV